MYTETKINGGVICGLVEAPKTAPKAEEKVAPDKVTEEKPKTANPPKKTASAKK